MVGLEKFKEAFANFSDNYVIIGGTACELAMSGTVVKSRATHDIDMVVVVETMTREFGKRLWEFIIEGAYRPEQRKVSDEETPKYELYRFTGGKVGYPEMIELLSRHPGILGIPQGVRIERLPIDSSISSLSAIIMDDDFYHFTITNSIITNKIRHASPIGLIALKAKAYLNLLADKASGLHVNTRNIKKHRSDVMKCILLVEEENVSAPASIIECIIEFVAEIRKGRQDIFPALAKSLDIEAELIEQLVTQLEGLFKHD